LDGEYLLCLAILSLLTVTAFLSSCGSDSSSIYHTPKFLVAVNSNNEQNPGHYVEVFPLTQTTAPWGGSIRFTL